MENREYRFSCIRLIALLLVIFCHTFEQNGCNLGDNKLVVLGNYSSVGVQVFLILSGYLYGRRKNMFEKIGRTEFVLKNIKKILLDYYVYLALFALPVIYILQPENITRDSIWRVVTFSGIIWGIDHLWYIPYIIACYAFTPAIYDIKKWCQNKKYIISLMLFLILLCIVNRAFGVYFSPAWIGAYIIGFFLPNIVENIEKKKLLFINMILVIISIGLNIFKYYVRYIFQPSLQQDDTRQLFCSQYIEWSRVFFALTIFLTVYAIEEKNIHHKFKKILDWVDKYSYDIYIVHMIYIKGCLSLLNITSDIYINIFIMVIVVLGSAILLNWFCEMIKKYCSFKKR